MRIWSQRLEPLHFLHMFLAVVLADALLLAVKPKSDLRAQLIRESNVCRRYFSRSTTAPSDKGVFSFSQPTLSLCLEICLDSHPACVWTLSAAIIIPNLGAANLRGNNLTTVCVFLARMLILQNLCCWRRKFSSTYAVSWLEHGCALLHKKNTMLSGRVRTSVLPGRPHPRIRFHTAARKSC